MLIKTLKSKQGGSEVGVCVLLVVLVLFVVLAINVFAFLVAKQKMDYFAQEMVNCASAVGSTQGEVTQRYNFLSTETGLYPDVSWIGTDYIPEPGEKIQYGGIIAVTLRYEIDIGVGAISFPLNLTSKYSGISHRFYKD